MSERKLLVEPNLPFVSAKGGVLPTPEEEREAMERTFAEMRRDLHRPEYKQDAVGAPRSAGTNGWLAQVPIGPPPGVKLIDALCDAKLPHEPLHGAAQLREVDPKLVRAKLEEAVAQGKVSRAKADAALRDLGIEPEAS